MAIRTNTLGKGAILNKQLNNSYDVVEYIADNLPLLIELSNKVKLIANIDYVKDHVDKAELHLSPLERSIINSLNEQGYCTSDDFQELSTQLKSLIDALDCKLCCHENNTNLHLSTQDRALLEMIGLTINPDTLSDITSRLDELENQEKPIVDNYLDMYSTNAVTNKVITTEINKKVDRSSLHNVAFNGDYRQLNNKPIPDSIPIKGSSNCISSNAVYEVLSNLDIGQNINDIIATKQDLLIAGNNIKIENNVISATGSASGSDCNEPISNDMIDEMLARDNIIHERISDSEIDDLCDRNDPKTNEFPICEYAMTTTDIDNIMVE